MFGFCSEAVKKCPNRAKYPLCQWQERAFCVAESIFSQPLSRKYTSIEKGGDKMTSLPQRIYWKAPYFLRTGWHHGMPGDSTVSVSGRIMGKSSVKSPRMTSGPQSSLRNTNAKNFESCFNVPLLTCLITGESFRRQELTLKALLVQRIFDVCQFWRRKLSVLSQQICWMSGWTKLDCPSVIHQAQPAHLLLSIAIFGSTLRFSHIWMPDGIV